MSDIGSILYPADQDPFKLAAKAESQKLPEPLPRAHAIAAREGEAPGSASSTESGGTPADKLYAEDPFAASRDLGFNPEAMAPENADQINLRDGLGDMLETAEAEDVEGAKQALWEAGANQELVTSLAADFRRHAVEPPPFTADECRATLREEWGAQYEAKMAMAKAMVDRGAEKWPGLWTAIEVYKSGNDPRFIKKIVARAESLKKSGKL